MIPSEIDQMADELNESCVIDERPPVPSVDIMIMSQDIIYTSLTRDAAHPVLERWEHQQMKDYLDQLILSDGSVCLSIQVNGDSISLTITLTQNTKGLCFDFIDYAISTIT